MHLVISGKRLGAPSTAQRMNTSPRTWQMLIPQGRLKAGVQAAGCGVHDRAPGIGPAGLEGGR